MPSSTNSSKARFLPKCCMLRVAGITPSAVPMTIIAMGKVAHSSSGASSAPIMLPISIIIGTLHMAIALIAESSHTSLKFLTIGLFTWRHVRYSTAPALLDSTPLLAMP